MAALAKTVLEQLAIMRLAEAEHLLGAGHFSGAYYLGGYAAELALKACIARTFQPETLPDRRFVERVYTHDLPKLAELAGLDASLSGQSAADPVLVANWRVVARWSEGARYSIVDEATARSIHQCA